MLTILVVVILATVAGPSLAQFSCIGRPDGAYEAGCNSYTRCEGEIATIIDCQVGFAYDWRSQQCEPWITVPPPCGAIGNDCTGYEDGRYPVMPNCTYFYTCNLGQFFGAGPCNPPGPETLVFDVTEQACNWRFLTPPPCGTFIPDAKKRRSIFKKLA